MALKGAGAESPHIPNDNSDTRGLFSEAASSIKEGNML